MLVAFIAIGSANAWEYVTRDGIKYVTMSSVRSAYGFTSQKKVNGSWVYDAGTTQRDKVQLKIKSGSQEMYANGVKFILSYPVLEDATKGMIISSIDINKILHPILIPTYIPTARNFTTVVLDPGHGGHDAGARNKMSNEKDLNLAVAKKAREELKKFGFQVVLTRETDVFLTLQQRVAIANKYPNAIFISIHFNWGRGSSKGIETFTLTPAGTTSAMSRTVRREPLAGNSQDSANIALATAIHGRIIAFSPKPEYLIKTKLEDRGIKRARFSVLCTIKHPAVLLEGGFMSHAQEAQLIRTPGYHDFLAKMIATGVASYKNALNRANQRTARPAIGAGRMN